MILLTDELRREYEEMWRRAEMHPGFTSKRAAAVHAIISRRKTYEVISGRLGDVIPWYVIGVIHHMESGCDDTKHLHNGDPLTARTVNEPKGRPQSGSAPFSFVDSAVDALSLKLRSFEHDLSAGEIATTLYFLEGYQGFGTRVHHGRKGHVEDYLWSASSLWTPGGHPSDGEWDPGYQSGQVGCVMILKGLPIHLTVSPKDGEISLLIRWGFEPPESKKALQRLLNERLPAGAAELLSIDGILGPKSQARYRDMMGHKIHL